MLVHGVCTAVQDLTSVSHPLSGPDTMFANFHLLCLITTWTSVSAELHLGLDTELDSKVRNNHLIGLT